MFVQLIEALKEQPHLFLSLNLHYAGWEGREWALYLPVRLRCSERDRNHRLCWWVRGVDWVWRGWAVSTLRSRDGWLQYHHGQGTSWQTRWGKVLYSHLGCKIVLIFSICYGKLFSILMTVPISKEFFYQSHNSKILRWMWQLWEIFSNYGNCGLYW